MENYPDEVSAKEEIGRYIEFYNTRRPHQALMNFTPAHVHQINNKTVLLQELKTLKEAARESRKAYWLNLENPLQNQAREGYSGMDPIEILDDRANAKGVLEGEGATELHSHSEETESPKSDSLNCLILSH